VALGDKPLGHTPLSSITVPCGEVTLTFTRPRYDAVTRTFEAAASAPLDAHVELARPEAVLEVDSTPSGATVTIQGAGTHHTPTTVKIEAFTAIKVTASLAGYKPWSQSVYARGKKLSVTAKLEKKTH
jgi:hypothetical protein